MDSSSDDSDFSYGSFDDLEPSLLLVVLASLSDIVEDFNPHLYGAQSWRVPCYHELFLDTLVSVIRNDEVSNPDLPINFTPKKLTENGVFTLPVMFTTRDISPSDVFSQICSYEVEYKRLIQSVLNETNWIFVVSRKLNENTPTLGFTAEIFRKTVTNESPNFTVYWMVHQMCKILSVEPFPGVNDTGVIGLAKIKILPESISCYPYHKLGINTRNRYSRGDKAIGDRCLQTPWSSWVYKQLNPVKLVSQLVARVKLLYPNINLIFEDPYLLSFDVLNLSIFTEDQKNYLHGLNSTYLRIHDEVESMDNLICYGCHAVVTSIENVFNMPHVPYHNHNRCYYDWQTIGMITTTKLEAEFKIVSELTASYCLHRGYKWQDLICKSCCNRMGWRYFTTQNSIKTPKIFYGLKRTAITSSKNYLPEHLKVNNRERRSDLDFLGYRANNV